MPSPNIPVLALREALDRYPTSGLAVYNRVSSDEQAGKGKVKLQEKTDAVFAEVRQAAPGKVRRKAFSGTEEGKLSKPRRKLLEAVEYATSQRGPMILVASDLSRFIRSESYNRRTNIEAVPTPEEFAKLRTMTGGVILATLADPAMTEKERHSRAVKRNPNCGRPPMPLAHKTALLILEMLGWPYKDANGRLRWDVPMRVVARRYKVSLRKVQQLVDEPVPGHPGKRWKDLGDPAQAYRIAFKGKIVSKL
jgi:hypothetical protein